VVIAFVVVAMAELLRRGVEQSFEHRTGVHFRAANQARQFHVICTLGGPLLAASAIADHLSPALIAMFLAWGALTVAAGWYLPRRIGVWIGPEGVDLVGILRKRHLPWHQVDRFVGDPLVRGLHSYVRLVTTDGRQIEVPGVLQNVALASDDDVSADPAARLNQELLRTRSTAGGGPGDIGLGGWSATR
jgi:hypothetical protein